MLIETIKFASEKHKGQVRRGTGLPYITHPMVVSFLVQKYKESKRIEELMVAALLHDTLEDTDTNFVEIATLFSPMVAGIVLELTSDEEEIKRVGKNVYLIKKMLGMSNYALTIKLADRLSNVMDEPSEKYKKDTKTMIGEITKGRILTISQEEIILAMKPHLEEGK